MPARRHRSHPQPRRGVARAATGGIARRLGTGGNVDDALVAAMGPSAPTGHACARSLPRRFLADAGTASYVNVCGVEHEIYSTACALSPARQRSSSCETPRSVRGSPAESSVATTRAQSPSRRLSPERRTVARRRRRRSEAGAEPTTRRTASAMRRRSAASQGASPSR